MAKRQLLVCDLDNTLYDWVAYFVPAFYAMVDAAVSITGCDRNGLLNDFRKVHQTFHDSEQPFALLETETMRRFYLGKPVGEMRKELDPAFHAFNSIRKKSLSLYPGVRETLDAMSKADITLVAHTESKLYGAVDRLRRLDLAKYFSRIYCRERSLTLHHDLARDGWFDNFPMQNVVELSHHQAKPNADVLLEICATENISYEEAAYVGDSVARDVLMAKRAGVFAIWAKYGSEHDPGQYADLVRISHWTSQEIEREKQLQIEAKQIQPDLIATKSFAEVSEAFQLAALSLSVM